MKWLVSDTVLLIQLKTKALLFPVKQIEIRRDLMILI